MTDELLLVLELLSMECDMLDKISFDDYTSIFSTMKSWKCL